FLSLKTRDDLVKAVASGLVAPQGLIAQGRGEAFDYLIGERTMPTASIATLAAVALLLEAKSPVISVNGNAAALAGKEIVNLASTVSASIEVNLFHRTLDREKLIARHLKNFGAKEILGVGSAASKTIGYISSFNNERNLANAIEQIVQYLQGWIKN